MWKYNYNDELMHYGVLGMKWGVRRHRNNIRGYFKPKILGGGVKGGLYAKPKIDPTKVKGGLYAKPKIKHPGVKNAKTVHEDYTKAHSKKSVKSMSDQELRDANNRLQMEKQYKSLNKKTNIGKKAVTTFISTAGLITATIGAYKTYEKVGNAIVDKIGDYVLKSIKI